MERVPRVGTRVVFKPSKAARMLYTKSNDPRPGEEGTVSTVSHGCARRHFMLGPRGGLVYVQWDNAPFSGVFLPDIERA